MKDNLKSYAGIFMLITALWGLAYLAAKWFKHYYFPL